MSWLRRPPYPKVRLSIERTPERTRLLNGHDTNCWFGSSRTTSIEGSANRTYFAAVAPPQPPPITTTRRPVLGAKSPLIVVAHPATPAAARSPSPAPVPDRSEERRVGKGV